MNNKVKSMIYGFVIGDAMGVPIEFTRRNNYEDKWVREMTGYGTHHVPEGTWSDDTSMTIATMDSIQEVGKLDYEDVMDKFLEWVRDAKYTATDVVFDIGNATSNALSKYSSSKVSATICGGKSEYDNGNGSLMRMSPVSMYLESLNVSDKERVKIVCNVSSMTHGTILVNSVVLYMIDLFMNYFVVKINLLHIEMLVILNFLNTLIKK